MNLQGRFLAVATLAIALVFSGCGKVYYQKGFFSVSTKNLVTTKGGGIEGQMVDVHPALVEYLIARDESNLTAYLKTVIGWNGNPPGGLFGQMYQMQQNELNNLRSAAGKDLKSGEKLTTERLVRHVAHELAPYGIQAIKERGVAPMGLGFKVTEDFKETKAGANVVMIMVNKTEQRAGMWRSSAHKNVQTDMAALNFDISGIEGVWDPSAKLDYDTVAKNIRPMFEGKDSEE
ncbi:MAG: hypothetical protein AB1405_11570 [Bdellovibrionota bacterium]